MAPESLEQRIQELEAKLDQFNAILADPSLQSDVARAADVGREYRTLEKILSAARTCLDLGQQLAQTREMLRGEHDPEMKEMIQEEMANLERRLEPARLAYEECLHPEDPIDAKDIILEIRAGAGGQEAALFAADLLRVYTRFCEENGWKFEILANSPSDLGGIKEVVAAVRGDKVYSLLKFESGVHRVQRVPVTERQGRIHTSTITVAVLPEADEVEVEVRDKDLRIDVYRSQGAGGQHVNTTDSAVRITHLPTGVVVACQDERSQIQNRARAMQILRARLLDKAIAEQHEAIAADRKSQVGTGDRSERIRTYNFPQNRVTDHRIGFTVKSLDRVMEGEILPVINALRDADRKAKLELAE
jgi:peptide chain release factor 1